LAVAAVAPTLEPRMMEDPVVGSLQSGASHLTDAGLDVACVCLY
jgi:hypothetical protein